MVKICLTIGIVAILVCAPAPAQDKIWVEAKCVADAACVPIAKLLLFSDIGAAGKWDLFGFGQAEEAWAQAYGGFAYSPTAHFQVGLGAGLEKDDNPIRFGGFLWAESRNARNSVLLVLEGGGSGFWYRVEASRKVGGCAWIGLMSRRFLGAGPRLEIAFAKTRFSLWGGPMYRNGNWNGLAGLNVKM